MHLKYSMFRVKMNNEIFRRDVGIDTDAAPVSGTMRR